MNFDIDHRAIAVKLFHRCWEILDALPLEGPREGPVTSSAHTDELERAAFASLYHWSQIGDAKNIAIGEWMIAHMYRVLGQYKEAERFAQKVIDHCEKNGLRDFYLAYGYLEMARIKKALGQPMEDWLTKAKSIEIPDEEDRLIFEKDLAKNGW